MARKLFEKQGIRTRSGALATGTVFVVYTDSAGTTLADVSLTSGGSAIAGSTVTVTDRAGLGLATLLFYGPTDGTDTLYLRCPADTGLGVQEIEADEDERLDALTVASGIPPSLFDAKGDIIAATAADTAGRLAVGANDTVLTADSTAGTGLKWAAAGAHPNLATHDALGLATDAELATHEADTTAIHGIADTSALATTSGVTSAVSTHAGLADPHTGYVLESLLDAKGDIVAASADNTPAKLTAGANDTVLTADSAQATGLKWAAPAAHPNLAAHDALGLATDAELTTHAGAADPHTGYVLESLVDAKGDIIAASAADTVARLAVGADGTVLKAASGQATGLQWAAETAHPNLATHDSLGLATDAELATHEADTTAIHGITNTALLATTGANVFTGAQTIPNNTPLQFKDSGATARRIQLVSGGNTIYFGTIDNDMGTADLLMLAGGASGIIKGLVNGTEYFYVRVAAVDVQSADLRVLSVGRGLKIAEGANARMGVSTLVGGTVVVANTTVTATSRIFLTVQSLGTVAVAKAIAVTARTAGTSFTLTSADATDTSVVAWMLIEPA